MPFLSAALAPGRLAVTATASPSARAGPRSIAGGRKVRVLRIAADDLGELGDLLGELGHLFRQLDELGVALRELGIARGQRRLESGDPLPAALEIAALLARRHTEVRSRSDPRVDPLRDEKTGRERIPTLREACIGAAISLDTTVEALEPGGMVTRAKLSDGRELSVDLLIGADGIWSRTRAQLLGLMTPELSSFVGFRAVVPRAADLREPTYFLGNGQVGVMCPIDPLRAYLYLGTGSEDGGDPSGGDMQRFRELFADFGGLIGAALRQLERHSDLVFGVDGLVQLEQWHRGAVLMVGDAAHAALPSMAQGAAMALEDAFVLTEELQTATNVASALVAFEARRRPRVELVQARSSEYTRDNLRRGITTLQRATFLGAQPMHVLAQRWQPLIDERP